MKNLALVLVILLVLAVPVFAAESVNIGWIVGHTSVRPGGQTTVQLTLSNSAATETPTFINLFVTSDSSLTVSPSTATIASLGIGGSQVTVLDVKVSPNAISKTAYITVKATYVVSGTSRDTTVSIPVKIRRDPILQIQNVTYGKPPEPGLSTVLSFDLYNSGLGPAEDLKIAMSQSSIISSTDSSGELFISELGPAALKHIEMPVTISPSAAPGLYSIPFVLTYYEETKSDLLNISKTIGLALGGKADFVVTLDSAKTFYFGRTGTASVSIANAGNSPAEFLSVKASSPYGTKEVYVGNLDSDDTETVDVEQKLPMTGGPYDLTLELSWEDKFGTEYSETKTVKLTPTGAPFEFNSTTVILLILLAFVAHRYRRRITEVLKEKLKK